MTVRSTTLTRQANEKRWLTALYERWPVQEEIADVNYLRVAEDIGAPAAGFLKATHAYKDAGILITRLVYERGRKAYWTLAIPQDEAMARLEAHHVQENTTVKERAPKKKTAPEGESRLVASVGDEDTSSPFTPLQDLRRDDQEALIAAARQYANRKTMLADMVAQLERAGINTNVNAFEFEADPRLEAIALVLPAIDRKNNQIVALEERIQRYADNARPTADRIEELERENRGLRRIVERYTAGEPIDERAVRSLVGKT